MEVECTYSRYQNYFYIKKIRTCEHVGLITEYCLFLFLSNAASSVSLVTLYPRRLTTSALFAPAKREWVALANRLLTREVCSTVSFPTL